MEGDEELAINPCSMGRKGNKQLGLVQHRGLSTLMLTHNMYGIMVDPKHVWDKVNTA